MPTGNACGGGGLKLSGSYAKGRWHQILFDTTLEELGFVSVTQLHGNYLKGLLSAPPTSGWPGRSRMRQSRTYGLNGQGGLECPP